MRSVTILPTTAGASVWVVHLVPGHGRLVSLDPRLLLDGQAELAVPLRRARPELAGLDALIDLDPRPRLPPSGSSWQLSAALAVARALGDVPLLGGPVVASGTVALDGSVGPVDGWQEKVGHARRLAGAPLVVAPAAQRDQVEEIVGAGVLAVAHLDGALADPLAPARAAARADGWGYLGWEHVDPGAAVWPDWREAVARLEPVDARPGLRITAGVLRRLGRPAPLGGPNGHATWGATWGPGTPDTLEVQFGPEGGRRVPLRTGITIGRGSLGPEQITLYADTARYDPRLGRVHAEVVRPGAVRVERASRLVRGGTTRDLAPGATVDLIGGDELWLTRATRLLALSAAVP